MKKPIKNIIIHTSDSPYGNAMLINKWHRDRGWSRIGYSGVILNGIPTHEMYKDQEYWSFADGSFEWGRAFDQDPFVSKIEIGAHARGVNSYSLGICLIGKHGDFTSKQILKLLEVLREMLLNFGLGPDAVLGHYEVDSGKTCPDINMDDLRNCLKNQIVWHKIRTGVKDKQIILDKRWSDG